MKLALEGKNSNIIQLNNDFKNSRSEKLVQKEDEEMSVLKKTKLQNKN